MSAVAFGLVARILTVEQFGSYATAVAIFSIASTLAEFGLQQTTVLELTSGDHQAGDVLRVALITSVTVGAVAIAIALVIVRLLPIDASVALVCMIPAFATTRFAIPFFALRQFELELRRIAVADVIGATTAGGILLAVYLVGAPTGATVRFVLIGAAMLAAALVSFGVVAQRPPAAALRFAAHRRGAWRLFRRSVPLGLTHAVSYLHVRVDQIMLAAFGLTAALAGYAIAYRFVDAGLALVGGIATVVFPLLSRAADRHERTVIARDASGLLLVTGVFFGLGAFYFAPIGVRVLAGPDYDDAVWILRLLTPALVISVMSVAPSQVSIVMGRARSLLVLSSIAVVANVALNAALISHIGVVGSIIATTTTEAAGLISMSVIVRIHLPGVVQLRSYLPVVVGFGVASFGALWAWRALTPAVGVVVAAAGIACALIPVAGPVVDLIRRLRSSGVGGAMPPDTAFTDGHGADRPVIKGE